MLTAWQVGKLNEIDTFLDYRSGSKSPDFWDDSKLEINPEWEIVRKKAFDVLISLGIQDLALEFDRQEKYEVTDQGKRITMQSTKIRIVRKSVS